MRVSRNLGNSCWGENRTLGPAAPRIGGRLFILRRDVEQVVEGGKGDRPLSGDCPQYSFRSCAWKLVMFE